MKDIDFTGQYYKQYAAKWANTLNSAIKWYPQPLSIVNSMVSKNFHPQFTSIQVFSVRATAVRQDILAGDPKAFRLLCNTNLNMSIPSRGSEEERIRILLWVWANIQSNRYNK